ncbi:ATP-binding protein [Trichocoleus desertorum AS-A10]|uniref:sensor histidine kinase n=1 Tax=Trichocoleus desertorum TaxID=1481672 RepID=UPI003299CA1C
MDLHKLSYLKQWAIRYRGILGFLFLVIAGYLGNYWRWSFFFNIDFLFGSIATWIVVCLYGSIWGTVAAFVASLCTYILWHHPYSIITFTAEALFVGIFFHRRRQNIVLLDALFWILIGMPLVWLFYGNLLQLDAIQTTIILLKQPANGIFNALIANLILTHLPIHRWVGRPQAISTLSLQQTLLNLLVAFVFFPTLMLMVLDGRQVMDNIRTSSAVELSVASTNLVVEVRAWYNQRLTAVTQLAQLAARTPLDATTPALRQSLELTQDIFPDFLNLSVVDRTGIPILSTLSATAQVDTTYSALPPTLSLSQLQATSQPQLFTLGTQQQTPGSIHLWLCAPIQQRGVLSGFVLGEIDADTGVGAMIRSHVTEQGLQVTLVDAAQSVVASTDASRVATPQFNRKQQGEVQAIGPRTYQWFPVLGSPLVMVRWSNSFFVQETPIALQLPWTLIVELPAKPQVHRIEQVHTQNLTILLLISGTGLIFATLISQSLINPLSKLADVTTNLPYRLLESELTRWPRSSVTELDSLVQNFQSMAASLTQKFWEIKSANELLEQRVQERTQQLVAINTELAEEISERRKAEKELGTLVAKLEQSNRELQDFASVASHDLQEPLRKIQAFGDRLKLKCADSLPPEGKDYLERMQNAAQRMQTLINDLLAFSRVTTKAQPFIPVDLGTIVQEVLSDIEVQIQRVGGCIEADYLPTIEADPLQMRQLFQNLISNALKFHQSDRRPIVSISAQLLEAADSPTPLQAPSNRLCQIFVTDNGIGFDEKYLDRIFTVFQRLHNRSDYEGTGVGLAICRKIAERHRGSITAKSSLGQGTTFIVTIPIQQTL